jgi:predicted ATP-grasp superfamily ATP-dependent carboligase
VAIQTAYPDYVHLIDGGLDDLLDTHELLDHPEIIALIPKGASIIVFKNTSRIEAACAQHGWNLLNPGSALAERIENKMTQVEYLGKLAHYLPSHSIVLTKDIVWDKQPLIIQWAHSHTGLGTTLVNSAAELETIKTQFPERSARVSAFVQGPSFTLNVVVGKGEIILGNISYQITGIPPYTENPFTTIGNDWSLTHSLLNETEIEKIHTMAREIGTTMQADGWRGLFGIDVMRDDTLDTLYLIEINARQPASTTYESILQNTNRALGMTGSTTYEAHLQALMEQPISGIIEINDGAQIVQRVTRLTTSISHKQIECFKELGCTTILYPNTTENSDLLRIQTDMGIMETHGRFNTRGKTILDILSN